MCFVNWSYVVNLDLFWKQVFTYNSFQDPSNNGTTHTRNQYRKLAIDLKIIGQKALADYLVMEQHFFRFFVCHRGRQWKSTQILYAELLVIQAPNAFFTNIKCFSSLKIIIFWHHRSFFNFVLFWTFNQFTFTELNSIGFNWN